MITDKHAINPCRHITCTTSIGLMPYAHNATGIPCTLLMHGQHAKSGFAHIGYSARSRITSNMLCSHVSNVLMPIIHNALKNNNVISQHIHM